jgi:adenosylmethionine-8-amino-7-oxononanoate transaminase
MRSLNLRHQPWARWDKQYIWHPFTQQQQWEADPDLVVIERGQGTQLIDVQGRSWLDGVSSLWCNVHGHRVPALDQALQTQLKKIAHSTFLGLTNVPAIELARTLIHLAPRGLQRVFYSDSGSEANEIAMKMAFQYWKQQEPARSSKKMFLTFQDGYHGDTIGSVSMGGITLFHGIFEPLLFKTIRLPNPQSSKGQFPNQPQRWLAFCVQQVKRALQRYHTQLVAVHMEPLISGAGGMLLHPKGFLKKIRQLCDQYQVLLIVDEVATGIGRTGTWFACEQEQVTPDLLCVAKNLTGGYLPLAATLTTEKIYKAFWGAPHAKKTFYHGHTFTGNPLACAVATANLRLIQKHHLLKSVRQKSQWLQNALKTLQSHPYVLETRLVGLMGGIEIVQNKKTRAPFPDHLQVGVRICHEARKYGILLRPLGDVIVLMPPLAISMKDLKRLVEGIQSSLNHVINHLTISKGSFANEKGF